MSKEYVEQVGEAYRVVGTRVSLDSIVYCFWNGDSPESIAQSFPVLTLEQVFGAIAYYLDHQDEIDEYLKQGEADYDAMREAARKADPMFYQKMAERRRQMKDVTYEPGY
jgi:uncharacterized protein (DUF433 family)